MTDHYVNPIGEYIGGFGDGAIPEDTSFINIGDNPPDYSDQLWLFPGWGPSHMQLAVAENDWRESEMPVAQQNVTAIEYGEEGIPGTSLQWKSYWLALRKWTDTNPDFPDSSKRPVALG